jgi:DNA-binding SARP family transcriptional activator
LIQQQRDLAQQRDYHRRAYLDTERAEHEAEARLRERLSAPVDDWMLAGGSAAPRVLGLPVAMTVAAAPPQPPNVISVIRGMLQRLLPATEPAVTHRLTHTNEPAPTELPLDVVNTIPRLVEALPEPEMAQPAEALPELGSKAIVDEVVAPALPATLAAEPASPTLHVYLLGKFRVVINDQAVGRWPASRGLAVFKYLLANHEWPTPREVLMDKFWPDAYEPELARNSLNVAISGLRRALRTLTDRPVIMFEGGAYQLNPDFRVWVDVEEFDRHLHRAQQLASYHQATAALGEYEAALNLYSDDFLADDPYEEWPVVQRERLRVAYLNALDRVSELHLERADYAACVSTCQTLLARDACREDIHCRLMVCFARQDQQPLALRQYQACVEALKTELQVAPAPATTQLYQRLRRREHV